MKVLLGGIRGTAPVTGGAVGEFGGDTTSVLAESAGGTRLVIDLGTGVRGCDHYLRRVPARRELTVLLTHYHLDHLIGLPSCSLLNDAAWTLDIRGPTLDGFTVADVFQRMLARPFWPLQLDAMQAATRFAALSAAEGRQALEIGDLRIRWCAVHHPGGAVAYRVDDAAASAGFVFATDLEWPESSPEEQERFLRLCAEPRPARLLLFDGQFPPAHYHHYRGWGHSAWRDAADAARRAQAVALLVIHHSPQLDDAALRKAEEELKRVMPTAAFARQGQVVELLES